MVSGYLTRVKVGQLHFLFSVGSLAFFTEENKLVPETIISNLGFTKPGKEIAGG